MQLCLCLLMNWSPSGGLFPSLLGWRQKACVVITHLSLAFALREGTKQKLGSRIPVTQNVGERKSNYRPCPFVYFQRRLLKIKTVDFFLISAAHIQEFLWPDTQCRQATWLKTDIFNHHLQGTGCTLRLAVFLSPVLRSLKARVLFWLFTGCRELIFWFAFKCVWSGSTEQQLKGRKQSKADS